VESPGLDYRPLGRAGGLKLMHCRCSLGRHARTVDEEHSAFSITLLSRGTLAYRTHAGSALLSPGWLMLGNPGDGYACSHEHGDGTGDDCLALSIPAELLDDAGDALGMRGTSRPRFARAALPPLPRVSALLGSLLVGGDEGFLFEEAVLGVVAQVRAALLDGAAPEPVAQQDERALAAAAYMERHGGEALLLDDVAQAVGLSPFHLLRVFRRTIGATPHQYLMRVRLVRAVALLRDTAMPVTEVAYEAGWSDLSNFTRTFRREVGCAPQELRKRRHALLTGGR